MPLILMSQILFQILQVCSNYWITLKAPISDDLEPHVSGSLLIYVYVALTVGSFACYLISTLLLVHVRCKTATMLFSKLHTCIFQEPISFFDSTPGGRVPNKVSIYYLLIFVRNISYCLYNLFKWFLCGYQMVKM